MRSFPASLPALFAALLCALLALPARAQCPKATNLQVTPAPCSLSLSWQTAPGSGTPTGWWVFRRAANTLSVPAIVATLLGGARTYVDTPPQRGVTYEYFISDSGSACPINQTSSNVAAAQLIAPPPPSSLFASYPACNALNLIWIPASSDPTVRVTLELADGTTISDVTTTSGSFDWTRANNTAPVPTLAKLFTIAPCGAQSAPSVLNLQLQTPAIRPVDFSLAPGRCSIRLAWTPHPQHRAGYRIDRRNVLQTNIATSFTIPSGQTSFTDTDVVPGVGYEYTLTATSPCSQDAPFGQILTGTPVPGTIAGQLAPAKAPRAATATLALSSPPTGVDVSFTWRKGVSPAGAGGTPISNSARFSGATGPALTISSISPDDEDLYALDIQSPCGTETRVTALAVTNPCPADFDGSGLPTIDDIFIFLNAWFAGCP